MSKLSEHLDQEREGEPLHGAAGHETEWLDFCELNLSDGRLLVCDFAFVPSEDDGLLIDLPARRYAVQAKVIEYPGDHRVSRLRVLLPDSEAVLGEELGKTWTDTAATAICDFTVTSKAFDKLDEDTAYERIQEARDQSGSCGTLELDAAAGAIVPFVDSGFGDGTYPVFELTAKGKRAGIEVQFIGPQEPYPFEPRGSEVREPRKADEAADEASSGHDKTMAAFFEMLGKVGAQRTGDREKDRAAVKDAMDQFLGGLEKKAVAAAEEFRQHEISVRRRRVPLRIRVVPATSTDWVNQPAAQERIGALDRAGFVRAGVFVIEQIPSYVFCSLVHCEEGALAVVEQSSERIGLGLSSHFVDGRVFEVLDTPAKPGFPRPEWDLVQHLPDLAPDALIREFFRLRPAAPMLPISPQDVPAIVETGFLRVQTWRAERGGWTLADLKRQKGLDDDAETTEELEMARHDSAEVWLFNWLRLQTCLPFNPEEVLEQLVVIHDDLTVDSVLNEWRVATHDFKPREEDFSDGGAREAFARVNLERGGKLRLVLSKTTRFPADFYLPA